MRRFTRLLAPPVVLVGALIAFAAGGSGASAATCTTTGTTTTGTTSTNASSSTASNCVVPTVTPKPASAIGPNSVTLNVQVDPHGNPATCYFAYGPTSAYGLQTAPKTTSPTTPGVQTLSATIPGLQSKTTLHYHAVCANAAGQAPATPDATVTTTDHGPSAIRLSGHTGFVSQTSVAGVFMGCYGDRPCVGGVTLFRNGHVIGHRARWYIPAGAGGIIHVQVSSSALNALRAVGSYTVTVAATTTDGQHLQGGDTGTSLALHIFR